MVVHHNIAAARSLLLHANVLDQLVEDELVGLTACLQQAAHAQRLILERLRRGHSRKSAM